jgi:hypothetical protein
MVGLSKGTTGFMNNSYYTTKKYGISIDNFGNYLLSKETNNVYAKAIKNRPSKSFNKTSSPIDQLSYRYYIRINPDKSPFNPLETHSSLENTKRYNFVDSICKTGKTFLEVNQSTFNKYLAFLRTQNIRWLKEIIRDIK